MMTKITITEEAMTKIEALTMTTGNMTMTDELVERLLDWPYQGETMAQEAADRIEQLTAERDSYREALAIIDAIDPEHHIDGCALTVVRGLVLRMGETARAALKGETT